MHLMMKKKTKKKSKSACCISYRYTKYTMRNKQIYVYTKFVRVCNVNFVSIPSFAINVHEYTKFFS